MDGGILTFIFAVLPIHAQYCSKNEDTGKKECAIYHVGLIALWKIGKALDDPGIATVLLAVITGGLVLLGREQSKTTRAQLRAYISIKSKLVMKSSLLAEGKFLVRNTGQTPAYGLEDRTDIWIDTYPVPTQERMAKPDSDNQVRVLGPSDKFTAYSEELPLSVDLRSEINREEKAIWATVHVKYRTTNGLACETSATFVMCGLSLSHAKDRRMSIDKYEAT